MEGKNLNPFPIVIPKLCLCLGPFFYMYWVGWKLLNTQEPVLNMTIYLALC